MDGLTVTSSLRAVEKCDRVEHRFPPPQGNARICEQEILGQLEHATSADSSLLWFLFALISSGPCSLVLFNPARQNQCRAASACLVECLHSRRLRRFERL